MLVKEFWPYVKKRAIKIMSQYFKRHTWGDVPATHIPFVLKSDLFNTDQPGGGGGKCKNGEVFLLPITSILELSTLQRNFFVRKVLDERMVEVTKAVVVVFLPLYK